MTCTRCSGSVHLDYSSGLRRCDGCERSPQLCRCAPAVPVVPEWIRRSREGRGLAKVLDHGRAA